MDITLREIVTRITAQQNLRGVVFHEMNYEQAKAYASEAAHALFVEVAELSESWPFASWKTGTLDRENLKREIIDCIFFLVIICQCFHVTVEELQEKFAWVLENNARRIENGEHKNPMV